MANSPRSFAVTPSGSLPFTWISIDFALFCGRHCVARTCSTSDVPIPNASDPKAPWVEVWLSPQTIVMPGRVMPSSGPMTCTMPWRVAVDFVERSGAGQDDGEDVLFADTARDELRILRAKVEDDDRLRFHHILCQRTGAV